MSEHINVAMIDPEGREYISVPTGYILPAKTVESVSHQAAPRDCNRRGHGTGSEVPMQRNLTACEFCGGQYVKDRASRRFCSRACSAESRKGSGLTVHERFWRYVTPGAPSECWEWQGQRSRDGYGRIGRGGKRGAPVGAHRVSYEIHKGEIPAGLQVDHLCRNHACVNPAHLEAVTPEENLRRSGEFKKQSRTHCEKGHPWTDVCVSASGDRRCRVCRRMYERARYARKREAVAG